MTEPRRNVRAYDDNTKARAKVLREEGLSLREISKRLGGIPSGTISNWLKDEPPPPEPPPLEDHPPPAPPTREHEQAPRRPAGARIGEVAELDYAKIGEYITGVYKLAGQTVRANDEALANAIDGHAEVAGDAWQKWIRSEPKVAAVLQRMMIGTPLGEVIGVHVSIVFAYVLARGALRDLERDRARAANGDSGPIGSPESAVADGPQ